MAAKSLWFCVNKKEKDGFYRKIFNFIGLLEHKT